MSARRGGRRWPYVLLALVGLAGALYSFSGMAMAGSFAGINPRDLEHWRFVARFYEICFFLAILVMIVAAVVVWRRRRRTG